MRKIVSGAIGAGDSGSRRPRASKWAILPRRTISTTAPGRRPWSISAANTPERRARRAAERPSCSGRAAGRPGLARGMAEIRSETVEEGEQGVVHFARPFLLDPMAGAVDEMEAAQAGQRVAQASECRLAAGASDGQVAAAGDEQRRYGHRPEMPRRQQSPISVEIAVEIESGAETGAAETLDQHGEILFGGESRQAGRIGEPSEKPPVRIDFGERHMVRRHLARGRPQDAPERG